MVKSEKEKIEALEKKLQAGKERLSRLKGKQRTESERMKTRQKIIVGAALLTDAAMRPERGEYLVSILQRAIVVERDRIAIGNILAGDFRAYEKSDKSKSD